jgi:hypothetical protein
MLGATAIGLLVGRAMRGGAQSLTEPFAVLQSALLGVVGLILAFGLALAVGRYEDRRAAVVSETNAIGTMYLRAQTLHEPVRTDSLVRVAGLSNRVPSAVLWLEVAGAAVVALGLLAAYLAVLGRGAVGVLLAAALVTLCCWSRSTSTGRPAG